MLIFVAAGLVLGTSARAVTADAQDNPYQGIVERNVFALKPAPDPSTLAPAEPEPPEIIPQGIMSVFGHQQVLFKTKLPGSKPGAPPQETALVLSVGQREGEIEVLAVDESTGTITFKNHGKVQEKNLEKDGPKAPTGPAPAPFPGISAPGGIQPPVPTFKPAQSGAPVVPTTTTFGGPAGSTLKNIPNLPSRTLRVPTAAGGGVPATASASVAPVLGVPATAATTTQVPQPKPLSPEEQATIMLLHQAQDPDGPPMPPIPGIND